MGDPPPIPLLPALQSVRNTNYCKNRETHKSRFKPPCSSTLRPQKCILNFKSTSSSRYFSANLFMPLTCQTQSLLILALRPQKMTPLHCAAEAGQAETVKALLEAGADKNAKAVCGPGMGHEKGTLNLCSNPLHGIYSPLLCINNKNEEEGVKMML